MGPRPIGHPGYAGYPLGVLTALDGEILRAEPPFESVAGRIYKAAQ